MRIVSLVPSLTEYLIDLGLKDQIVGRTRFCIHPLDSVKGIEIIGGTKNPNIEKIKLLKPDLVIANKEENRKEDVESIQTFTEVLVTEISSIDDAFRELLMIGERVNKHLESVLMISKIKALTPSKSIINKRCAYFIWREPWLSVGGDTYIHDVLSRFGFQNVFGDQNRYPEIDISNLNSNNVDAILLSSEPFPFKEKHKSEFEKIVKSKIHLVNGEWFSWYGSSMLKGFNSINNWIQKTFEV